ncbi:unnamed protein product [Rotaria sp. Silwood1]|nr:unnamed protein product [Rotaria sp. Silwood1]
MPAVVEPGQPVPVAHPRDRRHRQRRALLRGPERHPRERQGRPDLRHRGDPDRTLPGRPRHRREEPAPLQQGGARRRQGSHCAGQGAREVPGGAGPGQAGAHHRLQQGRVGHHEAALPDHGQAGHVRRQRGGRRFREQPVPGAPEGIRSGAERPGGGDLRQDRVRAVRDGRRRPRDVPGRDGSGRARP